MEEKSVLARSILRSKPEAIFPSVKVRTKVFNMSWFRLNFNATNFVASETGYPYFDKISTEATISAAGAPQHQADRVLIYRI